MSDEVVHRPCGHLRPDDHDVHELGHDSERGEILVHVERIVLDDGRRQAMAAQAADQQRGAIWRGTL
jgi:hypothetical protein